MNEPSKNEGHASTGLEQPRQPTAPVRKSARIGKRLGFGFVLLAVACALLAVWNVWDKPRSELGIVSANVVGIAPRVSGPIKRLPLQDNQEVAKGDLLFEIDPEPYAYAVDAARANRNAVSGELVNLRKSITAQEAQVAVAEAAVAQARTALIQAEESYKRIEPLLAKNYATAEAVDTARHARDSARAAVAATEGQLRAAQAAVQDPSAVLARLEAAEASLANAELSLRDCEVRAPFRGRVAGLNISAGAFAREGVNVITLIDTGSWHVEMDFREGDLRHIRKGDKAEVQIMTAPFLRFTGEVESVGWGVKQWPELPFPGLPVIRRELDWVLLAQDFPVRIRLVGDIPEEVLRVGATAAATIHARSR